MWPVHTWLPDAHTEALTAGLHHPRRCHAEDGNLHGYLRFCMGLFPEACGAVRDPARRSRRGARRYPLRALCAWRQEDVKRPSRTRRSPTSVRHAPASSPATPGSIEGSIIIQMVNHGVSTGALFLLVGVIYDRRHTRHARRLRRSPRSRCPSTRPLFFIIATMSSVGVPVSAGSSGFLVITRHLRVGQARSRQRHPGPSAPRSASSSPRSTLTAVQKDVLRPITRDENKKLRHQLSRAHRGRAAHHRDVRCSAPRRTSCSTRCTASSARSPLTTTSAPEPGRAAGHYDGPIRLGIRP